MHICMVSTGVYPILPKRVGAIEPYVFALAKGLSKTNQVDVFGVGTGELTAGNLHIQTIPQVQKFHRSLLHLDWRVRFYAPYNAYLIKNIIALHLKNPIDILHIHEIYCGPAAAFTKLSLGIPYVCSIHNEIRTTLPIHTCNKVLAVSDYIKIFLIKQRNIEKSKVGVLNVAVDVEACSATKSTTQAKEELGLQNRKIVLFVGRKCPEKGPEVLIKALSKVVQANPQVLAILVGPDYIFEGIFLTYTKCLMKQAEELHIGNNVIFEGYISNEAKKLYYNAADVFVCPSIWQDPSPTVIKEALSFGKPVVATNVGGTSGIITNGYNGLLVSPNNPEALANAVIRLISEEDYAKKLGQNGRKVIENKFSFKTVTEDCLRIYRQLV